MWQLILILGFFIAVMTWLIRGFQAAARDVTRKNYKLKDYLPWPWADYICVNIKPNPKLGIDRPITHTIYHREVNQFIIPGNICLFSFIATALLKRLPGTSFVGWSDLDLKEHLEIISWDHRKKVIEVELIGEALGLAA